MIAPRCLAILLVGALVACGDDAATGGAASTSASASTTDTTTLSSTSRAADTASSSGFVEAFVVHGIVTDGAVPVEGAIVMQGGGNPAFVTGPDGAFSITLSRSVSGIPTVVAAKVGYRSDGIELDVPTDEPVELVLWETTPPDNAGYVFGDPGTGNVLVDNSTAVCGHCHTTYVRDFLGSAHARATREPTLQDLYAGVASSVDATTCTEIGGALKQGVVPGSPGVGQPRCYVGGGVLADLNACGGTGDRACDDPDLPAPEKPTRFGACADCHAIGIDGPAGGRDLLDATGIAFDKGIHCDTCHHVREVDLSLPAGNAGALVMQRPSERTGPSPDDPLRQVMFGAYPDVPTTFMGGSYQPQFGEAVFCGGCHELAQPALLQGQSLDAARWPDGLPVHQTFSEWEESAWGRSQTPCQACHMPEVLGLTNSTDVTTPGVASIAFGFARDPAELHDHAFRGALSVESGVRFIDHAVGVGVSAMRVGDTLEVVVSVENAGAGHALPTGEPMRALLLLVRASGCGAPFAATGGTTVPDLGGASVAAVVGVDATFAGSTLALDSTAIHVGDVVRVVRDTGDFEDYEGVGFFADPTLTPAEKGIVAYAPVGEAVVVGVSPGSVALDRTIAAVAGDVVYVGAAAGALAEDAPVAPLAGAPGTLFQKVLVDADGTRGIPHHRAIDVRSDNRIPPNTTVVSNHTFAIPTGCTSADVTATVAYRAFPHALARRFGWDARDHVVGTATVTTGL